MACTLEELQNVEYEILCKFDDFCKENDIKYVLAYGTLLGAIRHDGFIPWDDDVDILMSIKEFNKFKRCIEKNPIESIDFSWINNKEHFYPFHFAKLRKKGTYMPEPSLRKLNIPTGVWIDIFVYIDKPKTDLMIKVQELSLGTIQMISQKYINRAKDDKANYSSPLLKFIDKCPDMILNIIRTLLFFIVGLMGSRSSKSVRIYDYEDVKFISVKKELLEPVTEHVFEQKSFSIPQNYDALLKLMYGENYMTPIKSHIHAHLEEIEL